MGFSKSDVQKMGAKGDFKGLIKALKDENKDVRKLAAVALGDIGDTKAVEPLEEALKDESEFVREAAEGALEKLDEKRS